MPTYEYKCSSCGYELEAFQKITAEPLTHCPQCQQETLQRGIGGGMTTFQFQGSGFYITDYQRKKSSQCPNKSCPQQKACSEVKAKN